MLFDHDAEMYKMADRFVEVAKKVPEGLAWKYTPQMHEHYYSIGRLYCHMHEVSKELEHTRVLDFGCGIGMGYMVNQLYDWPFTVECSDMYQSWSKNEKKTFDHFLDA